ncbi:MULTISPECIES: FeoA family protein [Acetobacterium]|uniref:Ferrous iron transport protein A n=1 Tax=Acetobacterium wieringae TaxID=52694 RepID=A0A5D0WK19_9FIRM|nr:MULTISPECIES: FeoA family protein [Acetobacterium]TYC84670.1 ferrous iron transport protein A [Acetobacterium wieringae]URN85547.1 ferrous iron transport protein A [Acetobacterium wieringae]
MPLSMCRIGSTVIVKALSLDEELSKRLYSMGLIRGAVLKVISTEHQGPMTIELLGSQLVLGYEIVAKIQVETAKYR